MTTSANNQFDHQNELAILYEIASISKHLRSMDTICDLLLDKATRLLGAEVAVFYLYDAEEARLNLRAARGIRLKKICPQIDPLLSEGELSTKTLVWSDTHAAAFPITPLPARYPVRAALGVPVKSDIALLGWLYVALLKRPIFEARQVTLFNALADQVASTLETTLSLEHNYRQQAALAEANQRLEQVLNEMQQAYAQQERLIQTIKALSLPVLPIGEHVLLTPLIGHIDAERSQLIKEKLLAAIGQYQAHVVILDITGISVVDAAVAQMLLETTQAARLLGARIILCGVSPEVAEVMVNMNFDLRIPTTTDLRAAMKLALHR
jgi:anti-anti-sigma factor